MKIIIIAFEGRVSCRDLLQKFFARGWKLDALVIEKGSKKSQETVNHLKSDFFNPPPLEELLAGRNVPVYEVPNFNGPECLKILTDLAPDLILNGGCARILKPEFLRLAKVGILNSHPGLLPNYRGRDIVGWAILNNDPIGVTIHFIDEGVDTGPILIQEQTPYAQGETLLQIRVRLMRLGSDLMLKAVQGLMNGTLTAKPQPAATGPVYQPLTPEQFAAIETKLKGIR